VCEILWNDEKRIVSYQEIQLAETAKEEIASELNAEVEAARLKASKPTKTALALQLGIGRGRLNRRLVFIAQNQRIEVPS